MPTTITLPYTLSNGATADATEVQADLDGIVTEYNTSVASVTGTIVGTTASQTLTNKTLTSPVINTGISGTAIVDEDTMTSDSATKVPTQQSVKAYVDTSVTGMVTTSGTQTLTNKRITKRIGTSASAATHTIDSDSYDIYTITAQAEAFTVAQPSGTPTQGQGLVLRIKDNGTARAITWNGIFRASSDLALPTTTILSKTLYIGFIYNSTDSKWDCLAVLNNF